MLFTRITIDPARMGGVPCVRNVRIPVSVIVGLVAEGLSFQQILAEYPDLEEADIREALQFAAAMTRERTIPLRTDAA